MMAETDLIRRRDVIEAIDNIDWYHQNSTKDMVLGANPDLHQAWYKAEDVYQSLESVPSAQPEPQWIPCSERLPEDVEIGEEYPTVIFCTKDNVYVGFYEYYLGGRWWAAEDYTVDNVIAWMPLPEPYKEGADE